MRSLDLKVMSLDLSLVATGVCHPSGVTETIKPPHTRGMDRLWDIESMVLDRIDMFGQHEEWLNLVAIEGYAFNTGKGKVYQIGELGGIIRLALFKVEVPFVEIPPKCVKLYATGYGAAEKRDMIDAANSTQWGNCRDDHQADAFWMWQMCLRYYDPKNPFRVRMPKSHVQGLDGVEWPELT